MDNHTELSFKRVDEKSCQHGDGLSLGFAVKPKEGGLQRYRVLHSYPWRQGIRVLGELRIKEEALPGDHWFRAIQGL